MPRDIGTCSERITWPPSPSFEKRDRATAGELEDTEYPEALPAELRPEGHAEAQQRAWEQI